MMKMDMLSTTCIRNADKRPVIFGENATETKSLAFGEVNNSLVQFLSLSSPVCIDSCKRSLNICIRTVKRILLKILQIPRDDICTIYSASKYLHQLPVGCSHKVSTDECTCRVSEDKDGVFNELRTEKICSRLETSLIIITEATFRGYAIENYVDAGRLDHLSDVVQSP